MNDRVHNLLQAVVSQFIAEKERAEVRIHGIIKGDVKTKDNVSSIAKEINNLNLAEMNIVLIQKIYAEYKPTP